MPSPFRSFRRRCGLIGNGIFPKNAAFFDPAKIAPDEKLSHLRVVRILHGYGLGLETMTLGQCPNFFGVVVDHRSVSRNAAGILTTELVVNDA